MSIRDFLKECEEYKPNGFNIRSPLQDDVRFPGKREGSLRRTLGISGLTFSSENSKHNVNNVRIGTNTSSLQSHNNYCIIAPKIIMVAELIVKIDKGSIKRNQLIQHINIWSQWEQDKCTNINLRETRACPNIKMSRDAWVLTITSRSKVNIHVGVATFVTRSILWKGKGILILNLIALITSMYCYCKLIMNLSQCEDMGQRQK